MTGTTRRPNRVGSIRPVRALRVLVTVVAVITSPAACSRSVSAAPASNPTPPGTASQKPAPVSDQVRSYPPRHCRVTAGFPGGRVAEADVSFFPPDPAETKDVVSADSVLRSMLESGPDGGAFRTGGSTPECYLLRFTNDVGHAPPTATIVTTDGAARTVAPRGSRLVWAMVVRNVTVLSGGPAQLTATQEAKSYIEDALWIVDARTGEYISAYTY